MRVYGLTSPCFNYFHRHLWAKDEAGDSYLDMDLAERGYSIQTQVYWRLTQLSKESELTPPRRRPALGRKTNRS